MAKQREQKYLSPDVNR